MNNSKFKFLNLKKRYLKFLKLQETAGTPFKNKIDQLRDFYIPISEMVYENFSKKKKKRK